MLRTRDYFLLLVTIVFLVVAVSSTIISRYSVATSPSAQEIVFVEDLPTEFSAVASEGGVYDRPQRLASLREKIKGSTDLYIPEEPPVVEEIVEDGDSQAAGDVSELRCGNYHDAVLAWTPGPVLFEEVEGARIVYREAASTESAAPTTGTSSSPVAPPAKKQVLLQLPLRSLPVGTESCISADVIGVSVNGALIRNSEVAAYAAYPGSALVGYALDGFPIYGSNGAATDTCGGRIVGGQYQYQISSSNETIINCYSGSALRL